MDFYSTPPEATRALIEFIGWRGMTIWEPACGDGVMVRELERHGNRVIGTDIATGMDFLRTEAPPGVQAIVTNPPFSAADEFVKHAAELKIPFAFLLKSQYWHAKKRLELFREAPPKYILPLTWRPDFTGMGGSMMDVAWNVWIKAGPDTVYKPLRRPT